MSYEDYVLLAVGSALIGAFAVTIYTFWQLSTGRRTVKGLVCRHCGSAQ